MPAACRSWHFPRLEVSASVETLHPGRRRNLDTSPVVWSEVQATTRRALLTRAAVHRHTRHTTHTPPRRTMTRRKRRSCSPTDRRHRPSLRTSSRVTIRPQYMASRRARCRNNARDKRVCNRSMDEVCRWWTLDPCRWRRTTRYDACRGISGGVRAGTSWSARFAAVVVMPGSCPQER
jgi:hypothetical protein